MKFVDRLPEMARLDRLAMSASGGLAVVYGRRRIGKTRLLLEWSSKHGGLYFVADQSAAEIQRRYFAENVAVRLAGFADVEYRDWRSLLTRLAKEADFAGWRGPVIFDELPYLVAASPELPSVLQRWLDHEAAAATLTVAIAGSSQRMMQGLVLSSEAPLFGRAREVLELKPIEPGYLRQVFATDRGLELVEIHTAWGGVPRYWELAHALDGDVVSRVEQLALDPLGPLHREPDRLLIEETPPAVEARPILDAIGAGSHRVSEIAGRMGRPATSMSRPLDRLMGMGLVRREIPFGDSEKKNRRSLYRIADPFCRLWFRVVAPYRGQLAASTPPARLQLLRRFWKHLAAQAWEDLCREQLPRLEASSAPGRLGPWGGASRWWRGTGREWDVVSESLDGGRILLGEVKWSSVPFDRKTLEREARELASRPAPTLPKKFARHQTVRILFVPEVEEGALGPAFDDLDVVTASMLIRTLA